MRCPFCDQEMEEGYILSDACTIAWKKDRYESAVVKNGDGIQLSRKYFGGAASIPKAYCCKACEKIMIDYSEE